MKRGLDFLICVRSLRLIVKTPGGLRFPSKIHENYREIVRLRGQSS